jgi:hypothetical protein
MGINDVEEEEEEKNDICSLMECDFALLWQT